MTSAAESKRKFKGVAEGVDLGIFATVSVPS